MEEQIAITQKAIRSVIGEAPNFFRPPYGYTNQSINEIAHEYGETEILWTLDTHDWKTKDPQAILGEIQRNVTDGSVVLMHDIHDTTVEAVELVLEYLHDEGFKMVTVSEIRSLKV